MYKGMAFPFSIKNGRVSVAYDTNKLDMNIKAIVLSDLGSMPCMRRFGTDVSSSLQEPLIGNVDIILEQQAVSAINKFEPRVEARMVRLVMNEPEGQAVLELARTVKATFEEETISFTLS